MRPQSTASTIRSRPSYNAAAATDAWDRALDWLAQHLP